MAGHVVRVGMLPHPGENQNQTPPAVRPKQNAQGGQRHDDDSQSTSGTGKKAMSRERASGKTGGGKDGETADGVGRAGKLPHPD